MDSSCSELIVVAIDFGTTFSGYAYSFKSDYEQNAASITCNQCWGSETNNRVSMKTPTAILLKISGTDKTPEYLEFGYKAQDKYTALVENDEHKDYFLLDRFKMMLYSESAVSGLHRNTMLRLGKGYQVKAIEPISKFIEFLKNHFWEIISKRNLGLKESDIRWVLTVPAIWTDGAKQFMKEAAKKAGISSSKLTIAYEPEAAALCCIHLKDPTKKGKTILKTGTKCIVIDAGGGTVDFTVNEVTDKNQLVVKHGASGGPWGGTIVDDGFIEIIKDIFGKNVYDKFVEEHREDFVTLYRNFLYKKRNIPEEPSKITFSLPLTLGDVYFDIKGQPIASAVSEKYKDKVKLLRDKIRIDSDIIRELFQKPCKKVVRHTKELLMTDEGKGITTLLLVGGFMGSDILQEEMKKHFPKLNLIVPEDPELAVVKGAVLFGHNPKIVKTRIARYTYGISVTVDFDIEIHPEEKKRVVNGIDKCDDIFDSHVQKGQTLRTGEPETKRSYQPLEATQTQLSFKVYVSSDENPMFVTEPSCSFLGKLTIEMPDTTEGNDRKVDAQMSFGDTEITVEAKEKETGKTVSANFNFLG